MPKTQAPGVARHNHADPWRCLSLLRFAVYAIVVMLVLGGIDVLLCEADPPVVVGKDCPTIAPQGFFWIVMGVVLVSVGAFVVQGLLDYYRRHHYRNYLSGRRY